MRYEAVGRAAAQSMIARIPQVMVIFVVGGVWVECVLEGVSVMGVYWCWWVLNGGGGFLRVKIACGGRIRTG